MRLSFLYEILIGLLVLNCLQSCQDTPKKPDQKDALPKAPNILLIIADDAGWNDMGFHGSKIHTPNIDKLANEGVQLDRFYAAPTCSPTRATLLTGMPASRMGIVAPISGKSEKTVPDSIETLPQALHNENYQTALMGKWHLGLKPASGPKAYGFDYSYGFLHGQIDQYSHHYKNGDQSWYRNGKFITEKGHATDLITKEAIEWITQKRDSAKPFFLQVAYSAPHIPLQEPEKWKEPYQKTIENDSRRDFAAAMTHLDNAIGKVLDIITQQGLDENTLIVFMSDNGAQENWYPTTQYDGKYGPNSVLGSNLPLRDFKKSNYEGAIRVPAIMVWKDHLTAKVYSNYISVKDLMPTFLTLAHDENIPSSVEGSSIWPLLSGKNDTLNHKIYVRGHIQESYIDKPWKIIRRRHLNKKPDFELYNIQGDPSEKSNVTKGYPKITAYLKEAIQKEFEKDTDSVNVGLKH